MTLFVLLNEHLHNDKVLSDLLQKIVATLH